MTEFITWEMLGDFTILTGIVLAATQFTKNLPLIKKLPTNYLAWIIAFILITLTHVHVADFQLTDIILYGLSAMFISSSAGGIYAVGEKRASKLAVATDKETTE